MRRKHPDAPLPGGRRSENDVPLCRWCNEEIHEPKRRNWHVECAKTYLGPIAEHLKCTTQEVSEHIARTKAYRKRLFD